MTKGLAWPSGRGESGKEVVKRLSLHLLGGNLAVGAGGEPGGGGGSGGTALLCVAPAWSAQKHNI